MSLPSWKNTSSPFHGLESRFERSRLTFRKQLTEDDRALAASIRASLGISQVTAEILVGRGISSVNKVQDFLSPTLRDHLPDPNSIKNVQQGAGLLLQAIRNRLPITVYSDFDVDGLSGASQLVLFLHSLGAKVNHYVPNRFREGYGLVRSAIETLAQAGTKVLVTVDCGITSHQELLLANKLGMKTMVVDHHECYDLPAADVIINPLQGGCSFEPFQLSAAGLVWMLLVVLRKSALEEFHDEIAKGSIEVPNPKDFLDLAALGTICDMVPLREINRVISHRGLEALEQTKRPGLVALKEVSGVDGKKKLSAGHVGFALGPRINAAGRLGDAGEVFELLTTSSSKRAKTLAESLNRLNTERRAVEEEVYFSCLERLRAETENLAEPALVLAGDKFHLGVIGIVAQRLMEQFYRPAAVIGVGEEIIQGRPTAVFKGSIRGVKGFHVAEVLGVLGPYLVKGGGHAQAGGFTLLPEKLDEFRIGFINQAGLRLSAELRVRELMVDAEVKLSEVDFKLAEEISRLAPFGIGNPTPVFVTRGATIDGVSSLGNRHLKLRLSDGKYFATAVAWNFLGHPLIKRGERVDIAYQPTINTYQGVSSVQLDIKEIWG